MSIKVKVRLFKEELAKLNLTELHEKKDQLRRALFNTRLNASTAHVKDYSQFKKLRRDVSRVLTLITQRKAAK